MIFQGYQNSCVNNPRRLNPKKVEQRSGEEYMKSYVVTIWSFFDPIYFFFSRLTCFPYKNNILRIRVTRYKGRRVVLKDGTEIKPNDLLIKIHLHNVRLLKELQGTTSELRRARKIFYYVQKSLPDVEKYLRDHHLCREIKGIIGISSLNKGCERLGFEVFEIAHPLYKWFKVFAFLPIEILSSSNRSIREIMKMHCPRYLLMSQRTLTEMYRK